MAEIIRTNPYPGLRPFRADEDYLFFGRESQVDELLARLRRSRFIAVVGASGTGKSSMVRAGLIPALQGGFMTEAGARWRIATFRPGTDPLGNLARALARAQTEGRTPPGLPSAMHLERTVRRSSLGLIDAARQLRLAPGENVLVLADQFEEIFARHAGVPRRWYEEQARAFVQVLLAAAGQRAVPLYVMLAMRSEYLGACARYWGLAQAINTGQYLIHPMRDDELREAVTGPAAVFEGRVASTLVNRLLNDLGESPDQLPILQHVLMRTWTAWEQQGEGPMTLAHYEQTGQMARALSNHAEEAFAELDEAHQQLAQKIFQTLTERDENNNYIRRPTTVAQLAAVAETDAAEVIKVVEAFGREGRSFLVPGTGLEAGTRVDISHESLIKGWGRLRTWAYKEAEAAQRFRRLATRAGEEDLLSGLGLHNALAWQQEHRPNAAWAAQYVKVADFARVEAFLERSKELEEAEAEAQRKQQNRKEIIGLSIFGVFVVLAFVMAWLWNDTRIARNEATDAQDSLAVVAERLSMVEREREQSDSALTVAYQLADRARDNTISFLYRQNLSPFIIDQVDGFFVDSDSAWTRAQQERLDVQSVLVDSVVFDSRFGETVRLTTTYSKSNRTLQSHLNAAMKYRAIIEEAARACEVQPSILLGLGSHQTGWGLQPNRRGQIGLFGIAAALHDPNRTGRYDAPRDNILFACSVLQENKELFGARTSLKGAMLWAAAIAAFNMPQRQIFEMIERGGMSRSLPEEARQVLNRAGWFQLQGWP